MIIKRENNAPALFAYQVICPHCTGWFEFEEADKREDNLIKCPHCKEQVDLKQVRVHEKKYDM